MDPGRVGGQEAGSGMVMTTNGSPPSTPGQCLPCQYTEHDRWFLLSEVDCGSIVAPDHRLSSTFATQLHHGMDIRFSGFARDLHSFVARTYQVP